MSEHRAAVPTWDLSNCEREPIHVPGAIQPHGFLLALSEPDLRVRQVSANLPQRLGVDVEALLGARLETVVGVAPAERVRAALARGRPQDAVPFTLRVGSGLFNGSVHRHDGAAILELEPAAANDAPDALLTSTALRRLQAARTLAEFFDAAVREVRSLTGFDRVLLYRFDDDDHGEVVAEAKADALDSFLGLHYPASDIPAQARELYRLNPLRLIPDASYEPAALVPQLRPDTGRPLDLSLAVLRSVSPIHREYMRNLGHRASMSLSIVRGDRLWGLVSCGHASPKHVPFALRAACETIAGLASMQIGALEEAEERAARDARLATVAQLTAAMTEHGGDVLEALAARPAELLSLVNASGAAVIVDDRVTRVGRCPTEAELRSIAQWAVSNLGAEGMVHTHRLAALHPDAAALVDRASGLLAFTLPKPITALLCWFRPEVVQTVNWAGNPDKPVEAGAATDGAPLHPRRSFALWKQTVAGTAMPWEPGVVLAASILRRRAIESDLGRQVERERAAVRARDELVAVVSHDLRTPLSIVAMQAALLQRTLADKPGEQSRRLRSSIDLVYRATDRMKGLLDDLLDLSKIEAGRFELVLQTHDPAILVEEAQVLLGPLAEAKDIELSCSAEPRLRLAVDAERFFQVVANLVGNAIRHTPAGGRIRIDARRVGDACEVSVSDTGPGIDAAALPRIFDRYWQARDTVGGSGGGAGLGLFIARGIVEAHGGTLSAASPPGQGATFSFTLPLAADAPGSR